MKESKKLTVTEAGAIIDEAMEKWTSAPLKESASALTRRQAKRMSKDPIFNAAAWMKYNFGSALSGETDQDWIRSAQDLRKILVKVSARAD